MINQINYGNYADNILLGKTCCFSELNWFSLKEMVDNILHIMRSIIVEQRVLINWFSFFRSISSCKLVSYACEADTIVHIDYIIITGSI